ncbi:MAG: LysM peptidoglycan-binding domain-containing protein [Anaerocolumna aminovalerica]|jgi:N-acetylmuramoyl-L-alanine amidase|uniref:cell wall hydrolase n=1 Tax=Anaerocolumna aminovalerica TaxID=1527 RepID=UPI000BE44B22|nr:cell wall hydrolase [Anaerocolumna aminovalerica]MBU5333516.1 LysM peptidoglycan-binding domain-containing protein [Anaerocolumna aminovalerica]MDU6264979.1 LysM peptidoglycan-binding domain-containing protein [Anaerocolumna aminovalerica]
MKQLNKGKVLVAGVLLSLTLSQTTAFAANYKIVKNDSLYKIGNLFGTSISTLKTTNKLQSDKIYPGQILDVPAKIHTVQKGNTLYSIAKKYNVKLFSLRKANHKWDDLILPGRKLIIPASKTSSNATLSSSTAKLDSSKAVISYTQEEFDLLARLITAEANGEPYSAMVGIGAVVVNRVKSAEWPNTISAVINDVPGGYYQFTPVENGYINNPATDEAKKAAKEALNGSDPSKKAMFYYDDTCTNEWIKSKPVTVKIGSMIFAK